MPKGVPDLSKFKTVKSHYACNNIFGFLLFYLLIISISIPYIQRGDWFREQFP